MSRAASSACCLTSTRCPRTTDRRSTRSPTTVQSASDVGTAVDRMLDLGGDGLQLELLPAGAGLAAGPPRDRGREATHPFAEGMTTDAAVACAADGASLLRLERPGWATAPGRTLSR